MRTFKLLEAFGWSSQENNQEQDVNEFNCILSEHLENSMEGTSVQGTYKNLFEGKIQNVIQGIDADFESSRTEVFNTLQLAIDGNKSIEESIMSYVEPEILDGDN